ncbi:MAG: hypothetical protein ACFE0K_07070 [Alcanivorax sp.]|uniref:hypothetical protein n=1 Tax=Alcanivorax sp. TaxID=1872427 RepID=UPI003DA701AB
MKITQMTAALSIISASFLSPPAYASCDDVYIKTSGTCPAESSLSDKKAVRNPHGDPVNVTVKINWREGSKTGSRYRTYSLFPGEEETLGCTIRKGLPYPIYYTYEVAGCVNQ